MDEVRGQDFIHMISGLYERFGAIDLHAISYYLHKSKYKAKKNTSCHRIGIYFPILGQGGVQKVISLLVPLYLESGLDVILITEEEKQKTDYLISDKVKRYVIEKVDVVQRKNSYVRRAMQLGEIFLKEKIDVLCYHCAWSPLLFYDFLIAHHCDIYFVLCKHQIFSHELVKYENYYFRQKTLFRLFDAVVVLSNCEEIYWKRLGINARYIPNPYDMRADYRKKDDAECIVWVGRLELCQKRFLDIIPIMRLVVDRLPDCKLKIYGSGNLGDIKHLENVIIDNALQNNIIYCGYTEDMEEIYSDARVQLSTAAYEAFPMNIYEGKHYGIPLVIYKLPYVELLKDQKGYIPVEQGDIISAAKGIISILTDKKLERKLQKEAVDSIRDFHDQDIVKKWDDLFRGLSKKVVLDQYGDFEMILDTIYGNYDFFRKEVQKNFYSMWKKFLLATVRYHTLKENAKIVIYPYGKVGRAIKKILNENEIHEEYIVDNFNYTEDRSILSLEQIKEKTISGLLFLVCSTNRSGFFDIRRALYAVVPKENILDLFPEDKLFGNEFALLERVF